MTHQFPKLMEGGTIGRMELKNRVVLAPMTTNYSKDGYVTEQLKAYYEARAKGGVGLLIVEPGGVDIATGKVIGRELSIDHDKYIPGLRELARVIHRHGAKAVIELTHGGREAQSDMLSVHPVAPSPIAAPDWGFRGSVGKWRTDPRWPIPRELTVPEIEALVTCFVKAAERAAQAGFDGVDLHAAHSYLISQFLSASVNKRTDPYGGSLENRARFLIEILKGIKASLGPDFAVLCRINAVESAIEGGLTLEEGARVAQLAQEHGADAIDVSAYGRNSTKVPNSASPPGYLAGLARNIKKHVDIPIMASGRMTPEKGEKILTDNSADFIIMGHGLIADPDLVNKAANGRLDLIRPCILCDSCWGSCRGHHSTDLALRCTVNPCVGKEGESGLEPVEKPKRILVIGSGPAGLEAAWVAASRGHEVILEESGERIAPVLNIAAVPPYKEAIRELIGYYEREMARLGVEVHLKTTATVETVKESGPDAVIIATGSRPIIPFIPGIKDGIRRGNVVTAADVLSNKVQAGEKVIIIGGAIVGCETAEFLADQGKKATILEIKEAMALDENPFRRQNLLDRLAAKGVEMSANITYETGFDVPLVIKTRDGEDRELQADTIVLAAGAKACDELFQALQKEGMDVYPCGDCIEPRSIMEAIGEGRRAGILLS